MKFLVFSLLALFSLFHSQISALNYEESSARFVKKITNPTSLTKEGEYSKKLSRTNKYQLDTMSANSTSNFERKQHSFYRQLRFTGNHEFAVAIYDAPEGLMGASANINLWKPSVEASGKEYSAAHIRIKSGTNEDFDVIEAGWHVFPWYYSEEGDNQQDDKARFFISWSNDSYQTTCYNLDDPDQCGGFVMETDTFEFGSEFEITSVYNGTQKDIFVGIWKDPQLGRWWLKYEKIKVGYWREDIFRHLRTRGTLVEWGGEVFNTKHNDRFTTTEMGSGHFASEGYRKASYFKKLKVRTLSSWISPDAARLRTHVTNSQYYTIQTDANIGGSGNGGFFYGGPGNTDPS